MDQTEKSLLVLVLALLVAIFAVSSIPKAEVTAAPTGTPAHVPTAQITNKPVIIHPGATASVMVLNNGAKASVEVI